MSEILYIVMPAYNEEKNIAEVVKEWYPMLSVADDKSRLVIADGGSSDSTLEILYELKNKYPRLDILFRPNTDHGTKVILLYKYALSKGADWVFQTDSDGQTVAKEFEEFWQMRRQYDAILGNRKIRGDGKDRKFVEDVLRMYIMFFFGVWIPDANAPFRLMSSGIIQKYISIVPDDFNLPNAVLSACFSRYNERVTYREITFRCRQGGANYMNVSRILKIGAESIRNFWKIKHRMNELLTSK